MNESLDVSIHGSDKIGLIERIVNACRYHPGVIAIEEDYGRSPVAFLDSFAEILRDEMDFCLINEGYSGNAADFLMQIISQWNVYRDPDAMVSDLQLLHHYLDICTQSGQMALVAIPRSEDLSDDVVSLIFNLLSRHSLLSVLLCGLRDSSRFAVKAAGLEISYSLIDFSEVKSEASVADYLPVDVSRATTGFAFDEQTRGQSSPIFVDGTLAPPAFQQEMPFDEIEGPNPCEGLVATRVNAARRSERSQIGGLDSDGNVFAIADWAGNTFSRIIRINSPDMKMVRFLILAFFVLSVLVWTMSLFYYSSNDQSSISTMKDGAAAILVEPVSPPPVLGVASRATVNAENMAGVQPVVRDAHENSGVTDALTISSSGPVDVAMERASMDGEQAGVRQTEPQATPGKELAKPTSHDASTRGVEKMDAGHSLAWWKARSGNYTVQVASAFNERNINNLARTLPAKNPHLIYPTRRDGKPWFVLIYGSFASRDEALKAMESLPSVIRAEGPAWVRKQGEVVQR